MKKLLLLALPLFLFGCGDNDNSSSNITVLSPASTITAAPSSYDFGTINAEETKTATFTINTDGFITNRYSVNANNFNGLDISAAETALNTMYQNQDTTSSFTLSFSPVCKGSLSGELVIITDKSGGATINIPLTANIEDSQTISLPYCSSDNPVITVTSSPENIIKQGEIQGQGNNYYINFDDLAGTNYVTITALSDTIINGLHPAVTSSGIFTVNSTAWNVENNQVSAKAEITFKPDTCSGPASTRFRVNGLDGTTGSAYLYVFGSGTSTDWRTCYNPYQLVTE